MQIIRYAELVPEPWRNGGGVTRVIAASGAGAEFDWRISIAEVASAGPFSRFDGVDRTLVLLDGGSMALSIDGAPLVLTPAAPIAAFAGEAEVSAALPHGPTRDFNVMTRRAACHHSLTHAGAGALPAPGQGATQLVLALADLRVGEAELGRFDCLIGGDEALALDGPVLVVTITA